MSVSVSAQGFHIVYSVCVPSIDTFLPSMVSSTSAARRALEERLRTALAWEAGRWERLRVRNSCCLIILSCQRPEECDMRWRGERCLWAGVVVAAAWSRRQSLESLQLFGSHASDD
jgi:hypothetical protein